MKEKDIYTSACGGLLHKEIKVPESCYVRCEVARFVRVDLFGVLRWYGLWWFLGGLSLTSPLKLGAG